MEPISIKDRSQEYMAIRGPNEIDLYQVVVDSFIKSGIGNKVPLIEAYFVKYDLLDKKPEVQRFYLNRYFNLELMKATVDSMDQRYCLINDGTIEDWIRLYKTKILPFLLQYNLITTYV